MCNTNVLTTSHYHLTTSILLICLFAFVYTTKSCNLHLTAAENCTPRIGESQLTRACLSLSPVRRIPDPNSLAISHGSQRKAGTKKKSTANQLKGVLVWEEDTAEDYSGVCELFCTGFLDNVACIFWVGFFVECFATRPLLSLAPTTARPNYVPLC